MSAVLDKIITGGLLVALIFTALAFGANEAWSVGLFELDGYYTNDPIQYASMAGLTGAYAISNVFISGYDGTPGIYNGEVALDIEMVMAMAPYLKRVMLVMVWRRPMKL